MSSINAHVLLLLDVCIVQRLYRDLYQLSLMHKFVSSVIIENYHFVDYIAILILDRRLYYMCWWMSNKPVQCAIIVKFPNFHFVLSDFPNDQGLIAFCPQWTICYLLRLCPPMPYERFFRLPKSLNSYMTFALPLCLITKNICMI